MTSTSTIDGPTRRAARKPARDGAAPVTGAKLAAHLGMTRQSVEELAMRGVIERRPDGQFNQDACRLAYLRHLRDAARRSARTQADAEHVSAKAELLRLRIAEKKRELMPVTETEAFIEELVGLMLTHLSGMAARIGGPDLQLRRKVDQVVYETRVAISEAATRLADKAGEAPLAEHS
jgi:hypothetical protein